MTETDWLSNMDSYLNNSINENSWTNSNESYNKIDIEKKFVDVDNDYVPYADRPETYIVPIVFAIIFVVGVIGNGTLVLIFVRERTMRNVPNTYILSLALGDLLVIITCVPFTSTLYTIESWPYGEVICKLSESVKDVSIGVSVFTLTALSAERYYAIVNPIRRHVHLSTKPITLLTALGIWVFALLLAIPSASFSYLQEANITKVVNKTVVSIVYCYPFPEEFGDSYPKIIIMFKFLCYYAIPLCIIGFFYILMAVHLELSTRNMPGEMVSKSHQIRARKKVAKMVLAFVIIFIICFLPYHIFMLWFHYNPNSRLMYDEYWHVFRIVGFFLSFINSCINPIALYCVSGTFRKHFNHYLLCGKTSTGGNNNRTGQGTRRGTCDNSSHTLVHFNSTVRRPRDDLNSCSIATTNTTFFNFDKT